MSDEKLDRIEQKIDKIDEKIGRIDCTLSAQHVVLDEHQKRSTNLETRIIPLERQATIITFIYKIALAALSGGILVSIWRWLTK